VQQSIPSIDEMLLNLLDTFGLLLYELRQSMLYKPTDQHANTTFRVYQMCYKPVLDYMSFLHVSKRTDYLYILMEILVMVFELVV